MDCTPPPGDCVLNPTRAGCAPPPYCVTNPDLPSCAPPPAFKCKKGMHVGTSPTNWRFQCLTGNRVEDLKRSQVCCINQNLTDLDASSDEFNIHRNFTGSIFDESILSGANFNYSILDYASFREVKISTAKYPSHQNINFYRASIKNGDFTDSEIGTGLQDVLFNNVNLSGAKFDNANLGRVIFQDCMFENSQFGGKIKFQANSPNATQFLGSVLTNVVFGNGDGEIYGNGKNISLRFSSTNVPLELNNVTLKYKKISNLVMSGTPNRPLEIRQGNLTFDSNSNHITLENSTFNHIQGEGKIIFQKKLVVGDGVDFGGLDIFVCMNGCQGNCPENCTNERE